MKDLKSLLQKRLKTRGIDRSVTAARVIDYCNEVLNEIWGAGTTDQHARAMVFRFGKIKIATLNPGFKQELQFRQQDVIKAVNEKLEKNAVQGIALIV